MLTLTKPRSRSNGTRRASADAVPTPDLARKIGWTPLLRLPRIAAGLPKTVKLYAKAEHLNPGGSVKDRAAWNMMREGLRTGALHTGKTLIDATSGNTGISYAMLGAALGLRITLAIPANASEARQHILKAYGADLVLTDPLEGTDGAQRYVLEWKLLLNQALAKRATPDNKRTIVVLQCARYNFTRRCRLLIDKNNDRRIFQNAFDPGEALLVEFGMAASC